jgi:hypothetical protein
MKIQHVILHDKRRLAAPLAQFQKLDTQKASEGVLFHVLKDLL